MELNRLPRGYSVTETKLEKEHPHNETQETRAVFFCFRRRLFFIHSSLVFDVILTRERCDENEPRKRFRFHFNKPNEWKLGNTWYPKLKLDNTWYPKPKLGNTWYPKLKLGNTWYSKLSPKQKLGKTSGSFRAGRTKSMARTSEPKLGKTN